jgi:beta-N-acetylhexosaminidase
VPNQPSESTPTPSFRVGETLSVETGVIIDHNGHPVPDGTGVQFTLAMSGDGSAIQQIDASTSQGVASASFSIAKPGLLEIRATSDPAITSVVLQLDVSSEGFSVTVVAPTEISEPTATAEVVETPTLTPEPSALEQGYPGFSGWFVMLVMLAGLGFIAYWWGDRLAATRWAVRSAMCVSLGGLLAYSYLALRLPGASAYLQSRGWFGIIGIILLGAVAGCGGVYAWFRLTRGSKKQSG